MNWKNYEKIIYEDFKQTYPDAHITHDVRIAGRYSKEDRQIDILIEDQVADYPIKIVVDTKYRSRKIHVKEVEEFIAMVEDVGANLGVIITPKGYSEAAIKRAHNGPCDIDLDIVNFDDLSINQGKLGIPYSGKNAITLYAPIGWIVDNSKHHQWPACLYQRGLTLETALKNKEFSYLNFWYKDDVASSITGLVAVQNQGMKESYTNVHIKEIRAPNRRDGRNTYIRVVSAKELPFLEVTGFIDCDDYIVFFVLFTREELKNKNMRKLACILQYSLPFKINFDNKAAIEQLKSRCNLITDPIKKAQMYMQLAEWYAEMNISDNAMKYRRLCWETYPETYPNIKPLIRGELAMGNYDVAIDYSTGFFSLAPLNPSVMQDLLSIYGRPDYSDIFHKIIDKLKSSYCDNSEALGNIAFHYGVYLSDAETQNKAIEQFKLAKKLFKLVDKKHYAISEIDKIFHDEPDF